MSKRCRICGNNAIIYIDYGNISLCEKHFIEFYERKISKNLEKVNLKNKCILVALSGGKDSVSLLFALYKLQKKFGYKLKVLHINLGIDEYSKRSLDIVKKISKKLDIPLIIYDIKEEFGWTIKDVVDLTKKPACSVCGIVKRWIMNKVAYEEGCEYVATGHNINDINTFVIKSMLTSTIDDIVRIPKPVLESKPHLNLIGRLKPQFFLTEKENLLYAIVNGLDVVDMECPYAKTAVTTRYKRIWETIDKVNPVGKINFAKNVLALVDILEDRYSDKLDKIKNCKICGFPTKGREICSFCALKYKVESKIRGKLTKFLK